MSKDGWTRASTGSHVTVYGGSRSEHGHAYAIGKTHTGNRWWLETWLADQPKSFTSLGNYATLKQAKAWAGAVEQLLTNLRCAAGVTDWYQASKFAGQAARDGETEFCLDRREIGTDRLLQAWRYRITRGHDTASFDLELVACEDNRPVDWADRKFGELSPDEKRRAARQAGQQLSAELTANAEAIGRIMDGEQS